jgi:hypothetical protein
MPASPDSNTTRPLAGFCRLPATLEYFDLFFTANEEGSIATTAATTATAITAHAPALRLPTGRYSPWHDTEGAATKGSPWSPIE